MTAAAITPIFRSFDEDATRAFYVAFLGFSVGFEHRFTPDAPLYLGLRMGNVDLHLSEHHGDATPGSTVRIAVPNVHNYCAELTAKSYKNARPSVVVQPWGTDDMSITDPSGNRLIFFTERV